MWVIGLLFFLEVVHFNLGREVEYDPRTTQITVHIISHTTEGTSEPVAIEIEGHDELSRIALVGKGLGVLRESPFQGSISVPDEFRPAPTS